MDSKPGLEERIVNNWLGASKVQSAKESMDIIQRINRDSRPSEAAQHSRDDRHWIQGLCLVRSKAELHSLMIWINRRRKTVEGKMKEAYASCLRETLQDHIDELESSAREGRVGRASDVALANPSQKHCTCDGRSQQMAYTCEYCLTVQLRNERMHLQTAVAALQLIARLGSEAPPSRDEEVARDALKKLGRHRVSI